MVKLAIFGVGRIGQVHAQNIYRHPNACLDSIYDINFSEASIVAQKFGAKIKTEEEIFSDDTIQGVIICSPTNTHTDLVIKAIASKKAILCEKPLALDMKDVNNCIEHLNKTDARLLLGFQRRFDPSFKKLEESIRENKLGNIHTLIISSRDPSLPSEKYLTTSGGIFRDMMIHDFDIVLWLLKERINEMYVLGSNKSSPDYVERLDDFCIASVMMKTEGGTVVYINNARQTTYGYDQRLEIFGSNGMLQIENNKRSSLIVYDNTGVVSEKPIDYFIKRYQEAYTNEMDHFIDDIIISGKTPLISAIDGKYSLELAEKAHAIAIGKNNL